jgi:carbamoyl-phosphate synthase large subunit
VDLVINIPKSLADTELDNDYLIRRQAVDFGVPLVTNLQAANLLVSSLERCGAGALPCEPWDHYLG